MEKLYEMHGIFFFIGTGTNCCYMENLDNVGTWDGDMDHPRQVGTYSIQYKAIIIKSQSRTAR